MRISNPPRTHRRAVYASGAVVFIAIVAVAAVRHFHKAPPPPAPAPPVPVTASVAERKNVPDIVNAIGTVQSIDSVAIQPRVTGAIEKIEFTPGQEVKKGQQLFLIDPRPYQAALDVAQAQLAHDEALLEEAQVDLTRYQTLEQQKSIAAQQAQDQAFVVAQNKGTVQLDQANVEAARLNLEYCHIAAPISGRAGALLVDLGNLVGPQTGGQAGSSTSAGTGTSTTPSGQATAANTLVSVTQLKPIHVSFNVPQAKLDEILRNQAAGALGVDAYSQSGKLLEKGKVTLVDNEVNTSTGTVLLQGTFANIDEALWPGEFVSVELTVTIRRNVTTVPASAVMVGPNGDYVYVIDANNKVDRVEVQQAARRGGVAVIAKGISTGQKVVTTGQYRLDNGTVVVIRQTTTTPPQQQNEAAVN